jgi:hypothetical protein
MLRSGALATQTFGFSPRFVASRRIDWTLSNLAQRGL